MRLIDADYLIDLIESKTDLEFDEITEKELVRMIREQPPLDEKEILRKAFERVVERLEDLRAKPTETVYDTVLIGSIIGILKEECGISE